MTRIEVTVRGVLVGAVTAEDMYELIDTVMTHLTDRGVDDPSVATTASTSEVEVSATVEAEDEVEGYRILREAFLEALRAARIQTVDAPGSGEVVEDCRWEMVGG